MPNILDYKKEFKNLYQPKTNPVLIDVPAMNFIMVDGEGNPNDVGGQYHQAVEALYALSYTIKMGLKKLDNYFEYVVPPLEGLWWLEDQNDMDFTQKDKFCWTSMIRQPEFVTEEIFLWALEQVKLKKPQIDVSRARFECLKEGLCVQVMHLGSFDEEAQSLEKIEIHIYENGLSNDIGAVYENGRFKRHHEIYLSDPRKIDVEKRKTVIRHPVKSL